MGKAGAASPSTEENARLNSRVVVESHGRLWMQTAPQVPFT